MIDVHVNKLYDAGQTSMDQDPVERSGMSLRQRWRGPLKCLPCTSVLVERWGVVDHSIVGVQYNKISAIDKKSFVNMFSRQREHLFCHEVFSVYSHNVLENHSALFSVCDTDTKVWRRTCQNF